MEEIKNIKEKGTDKEKSKIPKLEIKLQRIQKLEQNIHDDKHEYFDNNL